ncbi:MAG: cytochrome P450, partial [Actinomycetota bacterium]|nr:cytochrome P450 [Actinomycetota bacterium]
MSSLTGSAVDDGYTDITSHDSWVEGPPLKTFARLRDDEPVTWCDEQDGPGYWAITRYQDILDVSRDVSTFTSRKGIRLEDMNAEETAARRTMMELDPPDHTRLRRLVTKVFTRKSVEEYETQIRALAIQVIEEALERDNFDFVEHVAKQLPMLMLGQLMGTPNEDGPRLVELGDALLGNTDPEFTDVVVDQVDSDEYRLIPFRSPAGLELFE